MISDQHFIIHGGIGSFAKSFAEMCNRLNWKIDIILDKAPTSALLPIMENLGANFVYPSQSLKYTDHANIFAFTDSVNFEKIINFRNSLMKAFNSNVYDLIVCNTQESMSAAHSIEFSRYIPVVFYTHLYSMVFQDDFNKLGSFLPAYHNFFNKHTEFNDIIVGTQSVYNVNHLHSINITNAKLLPMPITDRELLIKSTTDKMGVLFIGRWEEGKNPQTFINVIKQSGLPAKIMTNSNGAKKFEKAFVDAGITEYEIKAGIHGNEKADFIKSAKVAFLPSHLESYSFAFVECVGHMPVLVLDSQTWSNNFDSNFYHVSSVKDAPDKLKELYIINYGDAALEYVNTLDSNSDLCWNELVTSFDGKKSKTNSAKINTYETVKYADYISSLNRIIGREDVESVLSNRHKFKTVYTDDDTYLSKDDHFIPSGNEVENSLFDGL